MQKKVEAHLMTIDRTNTEVEIAFFGGSFTGIPRDSQIAYLELASSYIRKGYVDGIRISTRPDYIDEDILMMLKNYGVTTIELGVQSLNDTVLKKSHRGHTIEDVIRASNLIKYFDFFLGLQMMIGLPGDSYHKAYATAEKMISLKPDNVRIYPTIVFKETELDTMYQEGKYVPLSLDEAIEWSADILRLFYKNEITVIRVGLQPTIDLIEGSEISAGPFHPSFKQLVESRMYRQALEETLFVIPSSVEQICINEKDYSNLVGHSKENIEYIKEVCVKGEINIVTDDDIPRYHYELKQNDEMTRYSIY
jgi:histone acetyltransferase (RNA polymerase elongator complex component)